EFSRSHGINNVVFHGRKPSDEMPKYYAFADAMIVTLTADPLVALTLPAKVQSYMSAGKPILASANGEISVVMKESAAGFCSDADDVKGFVDNVIKFTEIEKRGDLGRRAKEYYDQNFSREMIMDKLERILLDNS